MLTLSFPPRAIRLFGSASVTVPQAMPPRGTTMSPWTCTSSRTSKSTVSFTWASADEIVRFNRNLIGVPSSSPKARGCFTTAGAEAGCWSAGFAFSCWDEDSCKEKVLACFRHTARTSDSTTLIGWVSESEVE
jgi:hypothetical protein